MTSSHLSGALTTFLIHGVIAVMVLGFSDTSGCGGGDDSDRGKLKMTTIEAALAYKSKTKSKQPQKRRKRAKRKAVKKPAGVSRDETKKVEPKKKAKEPEPEEDFSKAFEKFKEQRQRGDDEEEEIEDIEIPEESDDSGGQFDGSEHGFAEVSKGDPYMQELAKDMYSSWELPTLEKGSGAAVGCVRLEADGKISDTKLETKSGNSNIDRSVRVALKKMKKQRNKKPAKVPRHLMEITTQWTCFKLKV